MSYPEDPDYTGKAPKHTETALEAHRKNLSEMNKTSIKPSSKEYEINVLKLTSPLTFEYFRKSYTVSEGYVVSHRAKQELFFTIKEDIKSIPGSKYVAESKTWYIPVSSQPQLYSFLEKYSVDIPKEETHVSKPVDLEIGDTVIAHFESERKKYKIKSKVIYKTTDLISVDFLESYGEIRKATRWNFELPFTKINYLEKLPSEIFHVDDIVTAYRKLDSWSNSAEATITEILKDKISFKINESMKFYGDDYHYPGTIFEFKYPFTSEHHLEFKKSASKSDKFKVGDIVTAIDNDRTDPLEAIGEVVAIESDRIVVKILSANPKNEYLVGAKFPFFTPFTHTIYLIPAHIGFKVGDEATAFWNRDGKSYNVDVEITEIDHDSIEFKNLSYVKLWDEYEYDSGGIFRFATPFTLSIYLKSGFLIRKYTPDDDFKVGELVDIYWLEHDIPVSSEGIIKELNDIGYSMEITGRETGLYTKGERITIPKPGRAGYEEGQYITHKEITTSISPDDIHFKVREEAEAYWYTDDKLYHGTVKIVEIFAHSIRFIAMEDVFMGRDSIERSKSYTFDFPFPKTHYLTHRIISTPKIEKLKVGDMVVANSTNSATGEHYQTPAIIDSIASAHIWVVIQDTIRISDGKTWDKGELVHMPYPFVVPKLYLTSVFSSKSKTLTPDDITKSLPVKIGDIVIAHFDFSGSRVSKAKITDIVKIGAGLTFHVDLDEKFADDIGSKVKMIFMYPFEANHYLEYIKSSPITSSRPPFNLTTFNKKLFEKYKKKLTLTRHDELLEKAKAKSIPTDEDVAMRTATYDEPKGIVKKLEESLHKSYAYQIKEIEERYIAEAKARGEKQVDQKFLTKMIKEILKLYFPATKFSVVGESYSMGHSIDVRWDLGPTTKQVNELVRKYTDKSFDGMTDSTTYLDTPWNTDSVHAQRTVPEKYQFAIANKILRDYGRTEKVHSWSEIHAIRIGDDWLSDKVNKYFSETPL